MAVSLLQPDKHSDHAGLAGSKAGEYLKADCLQLLARQSPDLLWAKDRQGRFLFVNHATCRRLLLIDQSEEAIGKTVEFFAKRERERHPLQKDWYTFGRTGADSDKLVMVKQRPMYFDEFGNVGGHFLHLRVHKAPLRNSTGKLLGTVASAREVLHGRQLLDLRHSLLNARERCHDSGAEVGVLHGGGVADVDGQLPAITDCGIEHRLVEVERLCAIGSLASSLAHEFNNPLCGVRSVLERVSRKAGLEGADQELMDLALKECDRMKQLIRDLQQLNLPSSTTRKEFDLNRAIDAVLPLLSKLIKQHKITVHKAYQGELCLYGVEDQIKQVVLNLLKNSCEAMPASGGNITIATARQDDIARLIIQDTGEGISEQHWSHLFEPFRTSKSEINSTGLGLAVSNNIVQKHQGSITLDSHPGEGTTVTIRLPIVAAPGREGSQ